MRSKIHELLFLTLNLNVFILFADILKTLMCSYTSLCLKYLKVSLLFHFFCLFVFETRVLCSPGWGLHIAKGFEGNQVFQKLSKSFIQCWSYSSFSRSGPACVGYISCRSTAESSSATVIWHSQTLVCGSLSAAEELRNEIEYHPIKVSSLRELWNSLKSLTFMLL